MAKASPFDPDLVRELATLLAETDLTEIEVEKGDLRIRVARTLTASVTVPMAAPAHAPMPIPAPPPLPSGALDSVPKVGPHPGAVTSPMVGTAYLAPEPGSATFVSVGQAVTEGQTLMIIEAMKTMNHIPAPRAGTVKRILIADGTPVEYGAPLMIVE